MSYHQPDFFRFGTDSLWLVEMIKLHHLKNALRVCELGAGSGVISCEIGKIYPEATFHCVELQKAFEPYLSLNLEEHLKHRSQVSVESVSSFNLIANLKFDLIVFNPPYFDPQASRPSPVLEREIARKLKMGSWQDWVQCVERSLELKGSAYWVHRFEMSLSNQFSVSNIGKRGDLGVWCARRLHIE